MGNYFSDSGNKNQPDNSLAWLVGVKPSNQMHNSDTFKDTDSQGMMGTDSIRHIANANHGNMSSNSPTSPETYSTTMGMGMKMGQLSATSPATYSTAMPKPMGMGQLSATSPATYSTAMPKPMGMEMPKPMGMEQLSATSPATYSQAGGYTNEMSELSTGSGFKFLQNLVKKDIDQNGGCGCDKTSSSQEMNLRGGAAKNHKKNKKHKKHIVDDDDEFDEDDEDDDELDEDELDEDEFDDDDDEFDDEDDEDDEDELDSAMSRQKGHRHYTQRAKQTKKTSKGKKQSRHYEETSQSGGEEYRIDAKYFYSSEPSNNMYGYDNASDNYNQFRYRSN